MLFPHGTESVGLARPAHWRAIAARARRRGSLIGVDDTAYPRDFASFTRYHHSLQTHIPARYPLPAPFGLRDLDAFLERAGDAYGVRWS